MVDMRMVELLLHFDNYMISQTTKTGVGCKDEVVIRTSTEDNIQFYSDGNNKISDVENIVETHYKQVLEEEDKHSGMVRYIRTLPELKKLLDEDGEFTGNYYIRTRVQFGEEGKTITMEQYNNLIELGWSVH